MFQSYLGGVKKAVLESLNTFSYTCDNDILAEQINSVKSSVVTLVPEQVDDDSISRYLTLIKLTEELTTGGNSNG